MNCILEFLEGTEDVTLEAALGQEREQTFDGVEPGGRGRGEVEDKTRVARELTASAHRNRKGDRAQLVVKRGALRVEATVRVDAEASAGSLVPVTVLEFGRSMVARVRDDGTLELPGGEKETRTK